jgi:hypothetical protein
MNEDDSFRMFDDKDVFYICMLLFMFTLVFGGCSQAQEEKRSLTASERVKLGYPCAMWIRQSGGPTPPVFACVKVTKE